MMHDKLYPPIGPYRSDWLRVSPVHELYFEECGNAAALPVVFLHGGPGNGADAHCRRFFDAERYRIVVYDQRGAGRSRPEASLADNTTWELVADLETLREHLGIGRWLLFCGSWGSTLALAYAEAHPERITGLVLRGVFLGREREIRWFNQFGASEMFPEAWATYRDLIPPEERADMVAAYYARLTGPDPAIALEAARRFAYWEAVAGYLHFNEAHVRRWADDALALAVARIECHYLYHRMFLHRDAQLLEDLHRTRHLPCTIVQGRYDVVCPAASAVELHRAWPGSELRIVPDAGHAAFEPGTVHELVAATRRFAGALSLAATDPAGRPR